MGKVTENAQRVLRKRYFHPGEDTWYDLSVRVAKFFATTQDEENLFYEMLERMDALPNSPTLMNAGSEIKSYSACFVLPIEDNIESIFKYYTDAGLIAKSGGGVGANFSNLREAGSTVGTTGGVASGPVSFMDGQDTLTEVIKQGGKRKGANMGILSCDHPDILEMVKAKDTPGRLENFNLSVGITDEFMEDVTRGHKPLVESKDWYEWPKRCELWDEICKRVWSSGEPGVLFMDAIERWNLVPHLGTLDTTNPCGEQPLLPYESCSLIAINLSNFVHSPKEKRLSDDGYDTMEPQVNWDRLRNTVEVATLFMNRVLDKSEFPVEECNEAMEMTRKIGVGIMGLHDMLIQLDLPYDSEDGRKMAGRVMECIADVAAEYSKVLGEREGYYGGMTSTTPRRRNAHLTTIAPTGSLSMIADCSSGCEPYYATVTQKDITVGSFEMENKWGSFKGAMDIHWSDHVKMQATLQKYVDSSISKTINMPNQATVEDIKEAYELAWNLGCKGITIYRDGSRETQVLTTKKKEEVTIPVPWKIELPDELESRRYRIKDNKGENIYVNVCHFDDEPIEMFIKHPLEVPNGYLNTISRLTTCCLRYSIPLDDITKALRKGATSVADVPARLARILDKYKTEEEMGKMTNGGERCPECQKPLTPESGCLCCKDCGWEKCS